MPGTVVVRTRMHIPRCFPSRLFGGFVFSGTCVLGSHGIRVLYVPSRRRGRGVEPSAMGGGGGVVYDCTIFLLRLKTFEGAVQAVSHNSARAARGPTLMRDAFCTTVLLTKVGIFPRCQQMGYYPVLCKLDNPVGQILDGKRKPHAV